MSNATQRQIRRLEEEGYSGLDLADYKKQLQG